MWRSGRVVLAESFAHLPATFDALLARLGIDRRTQSRFVTVDGTECYLKHNEKSHPFALHTLVLVTGPWRTPERLIEFRNLERLRAEGIPAARPVAFAEERRFGVMTAHLLLVERIPGATNLGALLSEGRVPEERLAGIFSAAGDVVGRMHAAGFIHRDLFARNLLVTGETGPDARVWTIDCRKGRWSPLGWYGKGYDLGSFELEAATYASVESRTAFFAAYARAARPSSIEAMLASAERNRRALVVRFAGKRAAHRPFMPRSDAAPIDPDAVRRCEVRSASHVHVNP